MDDTHTDILRLFRPTPWAKDAACRGTDPDLFFPPRGSHTASNAAKAVCARCPVTAECMQYALDNGENEGVWGGVSINAYWRNTGVKVRRLKPIAHGTTAGYSAHRRRDEPACDLCATAHAERITARADRATPIKPIEHGTDAGYSAHRRHGTPPCQACQTARATAAAEYRRQKGNAA